MSKTKLIFRTATAPVWLPIYTIGLLSFLLFAWSVIVVDWASSKKTLREAREDFLNMRIFS